MRIDLNEDIAIRVTEMTDSALKVTVGTSTPVDIEDLIRLRYPHIDQSFISMIKAFHREEKRQAFELALLAVNQEFRDKTGEAMPSPYNKLGARYLLMPRETFNQNVQSYDFNLYNLIQDVYTNVDVGALAHRMVDEGLCDLKYFINGNLTHMHLAEEHGDSIQTHITPDIDCEVVRATLESTTGTYIHHVNADITITGWRSGPEKVVLLYRKD
jgi:hypothetical protein